MSNQEPERPNLPGYDPQPQGYSAEQLRARAQEGASAPNVDSWATLREHMEGMTSLSERFMENFKEFGTITDSLAKSLSASTQSVGKLADETERATHSQERGEKSVRKTAETRQKELEAMQKSTRFATTMAHVEKEMERASDRRLRNLAQEGKFYDRRTQKFQLPGKGEVSEEEFARTVRSGTADERAQIAQQIALAREQAYKPARLQTGFRFGEMGQRLMRGDFMGAAGELLQPTQFGENLMRRGTENQLSDGMMTRLGGRALMGLGFAARPAALLGIQQLYQRGMAQYNQSREIGMITGEGARAGFAARAQAFAQGLNPFDILSGKTALQIQTGARERGFRGEAANAVSQAVGDVFKDLGTDWKDVMDLADESIRRGGMSLGEFRQTMMTLDDTAKTTNVSVGELQKSMAGFVTERVRAGGTAASASAQFLGLEKALGPYAPGRADKIAAGFLQAASPMIAVTAGLPPALAATMSPQQVAAAVDKLIAPWANSKPPGMTWREWAARVVMFGVPIFQGMDPENVAIVLKAWAASKGKGFGQEITAGGVDAGIRRARGAVDDFRSSKAFQSALNDATGLNGPDAQKAGTQKMFGLEKRAERGYITRLREAAKAAGLSREQIDKIVGPLESSMIAAPGAEFKTFMDTQDSAEERLRRAIQVEIKMDPKANNYFNAVNSTYADTLRGYRHRQGTVATP